MPRQQHISEPQRAYEAALRFLSYRPRSSQEVRRRLASRFTPEAVQETVRRLEEHGFLDDAAFAAFWRQSREAHRPRSTALIRRELMQKGVPRDVAEAAVTGLDDEHSAYRAAKRRERALRGLDEATFRRRLGDYLRRRGFSFGVAHGVVERLWEERGGERCSFGGDQFTKRNEPCGPAFPMVSRNSMSSEHPPVTANHNLSGW